jgi:exosome complex exonuclease DIS3/RRP44
MFPNDFHKETFIERLPDETPNDYNDRTIRRATKWFSEHFDNIGFVLITDDADNRRKALQDGLIAVSTREYVTSLDNRPELIDMLCNEDDRKDPEQIKYPEVSLHYYLYSLFNAFL